MSNGTFKDLYFVQGVFLQDVVAIVGAEEDQILDKRGLYQPNLNMYPFCGYICSNESLSEGLMGILTDEFGQSLLTSIQITEEKLTFVKTYAGRDATREGITYKFQKYGDKWVGIYSSSHTGSERAQCTLTPVLPSEFNF